MKKERRLFAAVVAVMLVVLLTMSCTLLSFASTKKRPLTDAQLKDKAAVVNLFNTAVNAVKTDKPSYTYKTTYGMEQTSEEDHGQKYLGVLVSAIMGDSALAEGMIGTIAEGSATGTGTKTISVGKGQDMTNELSVKGQSYVSSLTADDDFTVQAKYNPSSGRTVMAFTFPSISKADAANSSLAKVFDLLSEDLVMKFSSQSNYALKFNYFDITYITPQVEAVVDQNGRLVRYTTVMTYAVSLNTSNIGVLGFATGLGNAIIGIVQKYGGNLDLTNFNDAMGGLLGGGSKAICNYKRTVSITGFNWYAKMYGDLDNDLDVDAADARLCLRAAVGLDELTGEYDKAGADVDGDGKVTAADARLILRRAVELDSPFSPQTNGYVPNSGIIPDSEDTTSKGEEESDYIGSNTQPEYTTAAGATTTTAATTKAATTKGYYITTSAVSTTLSKGDQIAQGIIGVIGKEAVSELSKILPGLFGGS